MQPSTLYGRQVAPLVFGCTALWYEALRDQPVRIAVVRDPSGRRRDEAFFCTDLTVDHAFILEDYARRWTIEVTFHDQQQFLFDQLSPGVRQRAVVSVELRAGEPVARFEQGELCLDCDHAPHLDRRWLQSSTARPALVWTLPMIPKVEKCSESRTVVDERQAKLLAEQVVDH